MRGLVYTADLSGAEPLSAAARFHDYHLPHIENALNTTDVLTIRFSHAEEKPHRWRVEAIAALARRHAPRRVNGVAPAQTIADEEAIAATIAFVDGNEGVTGQLILAG
ncbi:Rossmann fold domain-containing protein [Croceicoccus hydrothermalis]|uniref:Rossmann fold domain-containing protein n=1 Tax=Croceicoccus hydrothermalis TaxID=2867964 RepID=UPI001EFB8948|nr:hypothetical protein [Croceicoccus hydrothermalis]